MKIMFVLHKIADSLLVSEKIGDLIKMETSVGAGLESLQSELETLVCFLKGVAEKQETDQWVVDLVVEIEKTLSEVDVILDALFLDVVYSKPIFNRFCFLRNKKVKKLAKLRDKIRAFNKNLKISGVDLCPYNDLRFLNRSLCVEDFQFLETAFPGKFPVDNLLNEGMHVDLLDKCSGLPLATVLPGKLWGRKHTREEWQVVQSSDEFSKMLLRVLVLNNYHDLPYYLKPCFLYLGLFPEGSEIDSEILFHLWIAEGLIPSPTDNHLESKMDIAQCYLDELINRSMIQVQQVKSPTSATSLFKTVLLHDLTRDICLSRGIEESFSKVMDLRQSSNQLNILTDRLSLYTVGFEDRHNVDLQDVNNTHPLRTLLLRNFNLYPEEDMTLPSIVSSLKHLRSSLRILHFDRFKFGTGESLKVIGKLTRLTYLSLSECFLDELPSSVVKLINLQTLDLRVQNSIRIPNILWKIKRLRHLYLPCQFCVCRDEELQLGGLNYLETLENFITALCNVDDLFTLPNLRHLELTTEEGNLDNLQAIMNKFSTKSRRPLHFRRSFDRYSKRCYFIKKDAVRGVSTTQFSYRGEQKPFY